MTNVLGQLVHQASLNPSETELSAYPLDLHGCQIGIYQLEISNKNGDREFRQLYLHH